MNSDREHRIRSIMSGEARDWRAVALRIATRIAEPFYATIMRLRNKLFDFGIKRVHRLDRPVISVGNITTGGTGKTPAVQWIARQLIAAGYRPTCLLRGYTVGASTQSDEAVLLERSLQIPVIANPDRVAAGRQLIAEQLEIDVILLDDGFQHRRLYRDLNLVLIDATNPFGYGHVLPRGMLREPLAGLRRADVLIVTRSDRVGGDQLNELKSRLREFNATAPILRSRHRLTSIQRAGQSLPIEALRGRRIFSFCGIGNPTGFHHDLLAAGAIDPGHRWFGDHHDYSTAEINVLTQAAKGVGAEMMVTTEKDWVKIEALKLVQNEIPLWHAQMEMEFDEADGINLMQRITAIIHRSASSSEPAVGSNAGERSTQ